jgi:hypothetical protein
MWGAHYVAGRVRSMLDESDIPPVCEQPHGSPAYRYRLARAIDIPYRERQLGGDEQTGIRYWQDNGVIPAVPCQQAADVWSVVQRATYEYCVLKLFHGVLSGNVYCCSSAQS